MRVLVKPVTGSMLITNPTKAMSKPNLTTANTIYAADPFLANLVHCVFLSDMVLVMSIVADPFLN